MSADYKDADPYLDLDEDDSGELGDKVQQVRAELENLKQKQEEIEREKARLEELKRRQDQLDAGRSEMLDKLTRALVVVQREIEETQKRAEQMQSIYNSFTQHLRQLESINARAWNASEMPRELSKALSSVEDARAEYIKAQAKLATETPANVPSLSPADADYEVLEDRGFLYWLKMGFALTLPLQVLGLLGLAFWAWSLMTSGH